MNIMMMTNTYTPFVGGVERSIAAFAERFRAKGHRVIVAAPTFENQPDDETDVVRMPAVQKFNGTDFSVQLPVPGMLYHALHDFEPDIVHSHHPYLIGDTALRVAAHYAAPIVFTFHTFYERYTHYVPGDSEQLKRFVIALSTGYANLCDRTIAPSRAVSDALRERGVDVPIEVCPTGIEVRHFADGDGKRARKLHGIPTDALVVGTVSRLAPEKNISFLCEAVSRVLASRDNIHFVAAGSGPSESVIDELSRHHGLSSRVHRTGTLEGQDLVDIYHACDVFAFASQTETQGLVIAEAMAAGVPVVALDGPGVSEMIEDGRTGTLVRRNEVSAFAEALLSAIYMPAEHRTQVAESAQEAARALDQTACADRVEEVYNRVIAEGRIQHALEGTAWDKARRRIATEMSLLGNIASATASALGSGHDEKTGPETN